jgi:hypothetical protein
VKVCFLVRDPRDTIVSLFFHKTKRDGIPFDSPSDLLHHSIGGFASLIEFYNIWWSNQQVPKAFMLVKYESLRQDTLAELARLCAFFGLDKVGPEHVASAVELASFESMRKAEASGSATIGVLRPGDPTDPQSFKTRSGKIGGYRDHFSQADIEWMNRYISEHLNPAYGYNDVQAVTS